MDPRRSFLLGAFLIALGLVVGLVISSSLDWPQPTVSSQPSVPPANLVLGSQEKVPEELLRLQNTSEAFVYIAEQVVHTVVTIKSTRVVTAADVERFHDRNELRDFFKFRIPREFKQQGSGSGIIVSEDGYILTNVHVVDKSDKIRVLLHDNREFDSQIVGVDPLTEVAVIKIDAKGLPVAQLGDSDDVRVGEWVLAIGNPLELRSTVTAGIISAKERQIDIIRDTYSVENFLQTDAAINPGNSGGALVNLRGKVIGVNTAIATETGYNAGFGFAIPINLAKKIMSDLIFKGKVYRGYLGIGMENIDEKKARALNLEKPQGVFISQVLKGEPADLAGVKSKDVLLKIDGQEVNKSNQVQALVAKKSPGQLVKLDLLRDGKVMKMQVKLGHRDVPETSTVTANSRQEFETLGMNIEDVSEEDAKELRYSGSNGVLVIEVERWSPADDAGLRKGDIITAIDEQVVEDKSHFKEILPNLQKGSVSIFTVERLGERLHLFVEIAS